jgi:hypothetical protein
VAERLKAPVLKTGDPQGFVSSNLTASAKAAMREITLVAQSQTHMRHSQRGTRSALGW